MKKKKWSYGWLGQDSRLVLANEGLTLADCKLFCGGDERVVRVQVAYQGKHTKPLR